MSPMLPPTVALTLLTQLTLIRHSSSPADGEGENPELGSVCWCKLKMDAVSLKTHSERQEREEISQRAKLQAVHLAIHFEKRKKWTTSYSHIG